MRNVWLALVAFIPLSAQACEGTYRGSVTQSFMGSASGDIELVARDGKVTGFLIGHAQKVKRPISGSVDSACRLIDTSTEGQSGKFVLDGTLTEGTGKSTGADPFRLTWTAKRVD